MYLDAGASQLPDTGVVTDESTTTRILPVHTTCTGDEPLLTECITSLQDDDSPIGCPYATARCTPPPPDDDVLGSKFNCTLLAMIRSTTCIINSD